MLSSTMFRDMIVVMIGGALGSVARYLVGVSLPTTAAAFPWPTFLVNVVGSFGLGIVAVLGVLHEVLTRQHALLLGTGLCGGFTTYSAFSVEIVGLIEQQRLDIGVVYVLATLSITILGAWLGVLLGRSISG